MTTPAVGLKIPKTIDSPDQPASHSVGGWAVRAENRGYDSVWISEGWGTDAFVELTEAALKTDCIRLCTAIVNIYSRTPAVLAMAGSSLMRLSGGRAVLGVGTSHRSRVESFHSMEYERPVRRTHEAIELVKAFTNADSEVHYDGQIFQVDGVQPFNEAVPVYNAALGAANRRATGRVADGWLPYLLPLSEIDTLFETVSDAARECGRDPGEIEVTPQVLASVSDDRDEAIAEIRRYIARYIGRRKNYRKALKQWFPDAVDDIYQAWTDGDQERARTNVTDELVYELGVAGTPEEARSQLREITERSVIDTPIVYVPNATPEAIRDETIEALAPESL